MIFLKFFLLFWYLCFIFFLAVLSEAELTDDRLMNECSNLRIFWYYITNNNLSCYFQTFTFRLFLLKITALAYSTYSTTSEKKTRILFNEFWVLFYCFYYATNLLSVTRATIYRRSKTSIFRQDQTITQSNIDLIIQLLQFFLSMNGNAKMQLFCSVNFHCFQPACFSRELLAYVKFGLNVFFKVFTNLWVFSKTPFWPQTSWPQFRTNLPYLVSGTN